MIKSTHCLLLGLAILAGGTSTDVAYSQTRAETLRFVMGGTVNSLDPTVPGSTREAFALAMSTYDRLLAFERVKIGDNWVFDFRKLRGELAESWDVSPDGLKITLHLRKDAKFQDGTPVTADDVKWSLDRHVSAKSLAAPQLLTGSITSPDQFKVIDPHTVELTLPKPDRLALPNLATVYMIIFNSKLTKAHVTADDPWAMAWTKENAVGSGAYSVKTFQPGQQAVLDRNDAWNRSKSGQPAAFKRVIEQTISEPSNRANLVERGDADLAIDLQASDAIQLAAREKLKVISTPMYNSVTYVVFNTKISPFDNVNVRKAIAYAMPYDDMFKATLFERGSPLFNGTWSNGEPSSSAYPVKQPIKLDLALAKKYLADAGLPEGFSTTFSFNVGQAAVAEPMAALVKEALAKIGIKIDIQKLPDAQMATAISDKKLPFFTENLTAWLPSTDYWYRFSYTGDQRWNYSSIKSDEIEGLANKARFELDPAAYEAETLQLNKIAFDLMPVVPLWSPSQDAVMSPTLEGYTYQFHRQVDFRDLSRK